MDLDSWIGVCFGFLAICSGIISRIKGDYFSRGMGISILTPILGIIAHIFSPLSNARKGNEQDTHVWPPTASWAVFAQMILVLILLSGYWFSRF